MSTENLPSMSEESETETLAVNAIERQFLEAGGHRLEHITPDLGRDNRLIFKCDGRARGYTTSLQVKGTRTIDTESKRGFKFPCKVSNLIYLSEDAAPAYYMIHNCDADRTYFARYTRSSRISTSVIRAGRTRRQSRSP